jgi:hypothetical protein
MRRKGRWLANFPGKRKKKVSDRILRLGPKIVLLMAALVRSFVVASISVI